jgi:hypothetical protein
MTDVPTRGAPKDPRASSTEMKIVERFHRTANDRMTYTVTIDDPQTQTTPWTAQLPWRRDDTYQIYEYACNEDNEAIRNFIVTSRYQRAHQVVEGTPQATKPDATPPGATPK